MAYTSDEQDPPASGTFWFGIDLVEGGGDEPAGECWVELWDDGTSYCEGYDTDTGDPCDDQDIERPGWTLSLDAEGTTPQPWQIWSLELPYVHTWPPQQDASYFVCEMAGNIFGAYICCCDQEDPAVCYCAEYMSW